MKKSSISKAAILSVCALAALFAFARQEKIVQIFRNGAVIQEYKASEIDYIEVSDAVAAPDGISATVSGNKITVRWNKVDGASYNVYRSANNANFALLASNLTTTSYTDANPLKGTNYYRVKAVVGDIESGYSASASAALPDSGLESGVYLGIEGFNQQIYNCPINYLDENSVGAFNGFIDGLTMKNGTILYYAVEEALNTLQSTPLPPDVSTVALVTFTDGLDQGSLGMTDKYDDRAKYLDAVSSRIATETVAGQKLVSYTIGLKGQDVSDYSMFRNNLEKLAWPSSNAKEVSDISAVNAEFEQIAKTLSASNYVQKLTLKCPVVSNGARIRFTLDGITNPNSVNNSKLYIEGTYNFSAKCLENVEYHGMECGSGKKVYGTQDGIFVSMTFDEIRTDNNVLIKPSNIDEWEYVAGSSSWQINSEFDKDNGADVEVTRSSAAIMLVLDCSSSLGSLFGTLQSSAKNFIRVLYEAVNEGEMPDPGTDPTPDDPAGFINGHEYVDLGLPSGLKWATCNVGASTPTGEGDFFAWGETSPKTSYTRDNSKTYGKAVGQISGDPNYDAARANWGGSWRMPSSLECQELIDKCSWNWTTKSGIIGYEVTGPNGKSIFLPAAGYRDGTSHGSAGSYGGYWSSTPDGTNSAYVLNFSSGYRRVYDNYRYYGQSVRAVSE